MITINDATSVAASFNSNTIKLAHYDQVAIQCIPDSWVGVGTITLQGSLDDSNWADITQKVTVDSSLDSFLFTPDRSAIPYYRIAFAAHGTPSGTMTIKAHFKSVFG
jgi:hypothetical protein